MNRKGYDKAMYDILDGNSKFKKLKKDPILLKEGQLRFIRTYNVLLELLKKQGIFDQNTLGYMALLRFIKPLLIFLHL